MPAPEILLVRHSETEWSASGRHTGRTDVPLTEAGRDRARFLAGVLAGRRYELVLSSPLTRARETCEIAGLGDQAQTSEALLEWDYGDYEGLTTPQIQAQRPDWYLWRDGCPGGESPGQVAARVDPLVERLSRLDGDAVLFAHGHVLRVLTARWLGLEPGAGALWALSTASVSALGWERETRVIWRWNLVSDALPAAGSG
jgi:probable phosphoglycerate mutase